MKKQFLFIAAIVASLQLMAQTKPTVKTVTKPNLAAKPTTSNSVVMKDARDSASYALGYRIAESLKSQSLQNINMDVFKVGMNALFTSKTIMSDSILDNAIKKYQEKMSLEKMNANRQAGKVYMEANGKKPGVTTTASGLQYEVLVAGTGTDKPKISSKVKCHYEGTTLDGTVFDSSVKRGEPIVFPLNGVIRGWQEGVQLMTVGSKFRFVIPSELAYGERQAGQFITPGSTLIFEVELLGIE
jgi:FKBP-type peptidyl-prolyl cis-trans isomerase FklB